MDELSLGELVAVLALGQDSAFGQPRRARPRWPGRPMGSLAG
jgi:hypothetical protein